MKNYILPLTMLVLVWGALQPLHASSQDETAEPKKIMLSVNKNLKIERPKPNVQIVVGLSEAQKKINASENNRQLVARERVQATEVTPSAPINPDYSLDQLRALYREAASRFGIDWKLIEAVHQVETGKSTGGCKKSYAGATGPMQFMPSTFRHYAIEGNDICSLRDSVFAGANLLAAGGADRGDIDSALFNYNHSRSYVELVKSVMNSI